MQTLYAKPGRKGEEMVISGPSEGAGAGWEVVQSLCWILLVNGVCRKGHLLHPPYLTLSSTIVVFLINTDLIFPPPSVLPPIVVIQLVVPHQLGLGDVLEPGGDVEEGADSIAIGI